MEDALSFSAIESGKLRLQEEATEVGKLCQSVVLQCRSRAAAKDLQLNLLLAPDLPTWVLVDPIRLTQILLNLVSNAVKFTATGHVDVDISMEHGTATTDNGVVTMSVNGSQQRPRMVFAVRDTGPGIAADTMNQLFVPYSRLKQRSCKVQPGTGLGLSIVKQLAELMQGQITVNSVVGAGSTFAVYLPLVEARPRTSSVVIDCLPQTASDWKPRVLVVDDSSTNRRLMSRLLQTLGVECDVSDNGLHAIGEVQAKHSGYYALCLMDLSMPVMDGIDATTRLRALGYKFPIIALTGNVMTGERERCFAVGMSSYLAKPVRKTDLITALRHHLPMWTPTSSLRVIKRSPSAALESPRKDEMLIHEAYALTAPLLQT